MAPVLCLITDRQRHGSNWADDLTSQVAKASRNGIHLVQIRERDLDGGPLYTLVARIVAAVRGTTTRIIVNERVDVALAAGAHGVHLRSDSMPAARVRALRQRPFLIGRSIHSVEEAGAADAAALDYLIFGTVYATSSKPGREPAGVHALARAAKATTLPVLAVGGVTRERIAELMANGAAGAAGIRAFLATSD